MLIETGIKIDGTDITDLVALKGVQWKRNDIDGPNTGRTLSGLMVRDRVATKIRLDITCAPLPLEQLRPLLNLIYPEFVTVTYDDPMEGIVSKVMYSNNNSAQFMLKKQTIGESGSEYWNSITFPLIER